MASVLPYRRAGWDRRNEDSTPAVSRCRLVVASVLNLPLVGLINGGPNFQTRLVAERGLSWHEAAWVFDLAVSMMVGGGLLISICQLPMRVQAVGGLIVELVGLIVLGMSWDVHQIAIGLGLVAIGGMSLYLASVRLASAADNQHFAFVFAASYSVSAYTSYALLVPSLPLDLFCLALAAATIPMTGVGYCIYRPIPDLGCKPRYQCLSWWRASGLKEYRYWAFCLYFGLCTGGLTWSTGCFDGTVVATLGPDDVFGSWLMSLYPLVYNASFLWVPFFGFWVRCHGFFAPGLAVAVVTQVMLACLVWPSRATLCLAMVCSSVSNSIAYGLQVVYLLSFPQKDFPVLLSGTLAAQAAALLLVAAWPKQGAEAARAWLCVALLTYVWPYIHRREHQRLRDTPRHAGCVEGSLSGSLSESLSAPMASAEQPACLPHAAIRAAATHLAGAS